MGPPCRSCPLADASGARCAPPRAPHGGALRAHDLSGCARGLLPRRRPAPNSLADTRRDNLLGLSPSPSGRRKTDRARLRAARRAFRAEKKKFFPEEGKKNFFSAEKIFFSTKIFFSPRKNLGIGNFFPEWRV